ncbi:hypothetical protein MVEN_01490500 [Mycena venus]|uniref:FAD/NAD(P)-binding domain-containing protein n=1 Tax=Mycena venus TaxID=2733690 RepID=A0A8H6XTQ3_9AGAR|nr:hypothetical protein MVEN_01490500 [Mycena venus]
MVPAISNVNELPGSFISLDLVTVFDENEALDVAKSISPAISELLSHPSKSSLEALFHPDAFWRDHVSLSWSLRTFHPRSVISEKVVPILERAEIIPSSVVLQEEDVHAIMFPNGVSCVRVPFAFWTSNPKAQCTAAFKLIRMKNGDVKVFTVTTAIEELATVPWQNIPSDAPLDIPSTVPALLDVLVVGGGHAGLSISAYLKSLGVNFAMVEKQPEIGDSWAKRYDSTTLHTTRIFSGLPFIPFPSDYPLYIPAKLIASYYAKYVQDLNLPAYPGRECISAVWDDVQTQWTVILQGSAGTEIVSARNLVFAVGVIGRRPIIPDIPGRDSFLGESLHSGVYKDASSWAGKRVAIVGSSTTACDVALDCSGIGVDVVMIQRGPTRIYPQAHISAILGFFWNTEIPVEVGDVMATEDPVVLQATLSALLLGQMKDKHDPEYYEGLRRAGFLVTVEGSIHQYSVAAVPTILTLGLVLLLLVERQAAIPRNLKDSSLTFSSQIKVKSGAKIEAITPTGIAFSDGTQLDADVIVYATGFEKDSRQAVAPIIGPEQAAVLEPVWGLDAEGEVRGCWRPSGHDHIWFHGGDLQMMRYYGQFLALQIAAEIAKIARSAGFVDLHGVLLHAIVPVIRMRPPKDAAVRRQVSVSCVIFFKFIALLDLDGRAARGMVPAISNISELPGSFVPLDLVTVFDENEALDVAKSITPAISELLSHPSKSSLEALFHPDAFWRDYVSLSWSLRTFHPSSVISEKVVPILERAEIIPSSIVLQEEDVHAIMFPNGVSCVRVPFAFWTSNPKAQCTAAFKLIRMKNGDVKVFTVTTAIEELATVPWQNIPSDAPLDIPSTVPALLDVLVVGGGHAGLSISAYLKSLGVNFAMVEKQPEIGDSWAKRYDSTTLHTTRIVSGLPFIPFPSDYPLYVPAKLVASYYAKYVQDLNLPAYLGRECISAVWDDAQTQWTVILQGSAGTEIVSARNLVFAVGIGGRRPIVPDFPGRDSFLGESLHSGVYKEASLWAGKRVAIVGSSTTACDVALDCSRVGADVVMIQRGPTRIYPQEHIGAMLALFWNTEIPVEVGDMKDEHDPEYYEGLRRAGFLATVEGSIHQQAFCRSGAHYPDVGACAAIARGEIKVKSGAKIEAITPTGIAFSDGTQLNADVIVYATGFEKDSRQAVAPIIGAEQAALLEPVWGLDAEGEVRGCWRPSGHDHIWFHGGELQTMRYYGRFLALQIAAEIAKVRPTPCRG